MNRAVIERVQDYVRSKGDRLSGLTRREALRVMRKQGLVGPDDPR